MLQSDRPQRIQGLIFDPPTSHSLQDKSCASIRVRVRSAAFMLPGIRSRGAQGSV